MIEAKQFFIDFHWKIEFEQRWLDGWVNSLASMWIQAWEESICDWPLQNSSGTWRFLHVAAFRQSILSEYPMATSDDHKE